MAKKSTRAGKEAKKVKAASPRATAKATKELKAHHLASVCAEIENLRGSNGRIPRGEVTKVYERYKPIYGWLTIDIIKKALKNSKKKI
jgi:hypothetical protein